jgi:hypothetical protein
VTLTKRWRVAPAFARVHPPLCGASLVKQTWASAAKLRAGGPIYGSGKRAMRTRPPSAAAPKGGSRRAGTTRSSRCGGSREASLSARSCASLTQRICPSGRRPRHHAGNAADEFQILLLNGNFSTEINPALDLSLTMARGDRFAPIAVIWFTVDPCRALPTRLRQVAGRLGRT